jgi:hypothetical protein
MSYKLNLNMVNTALAILHTLIQKVKEVFTKWQVLFTNRWKQVKQCLKIHTDLKRKKTAGRLPSLQ